MEDCPPDKGGWEWVGCQPCVRRQLCVSAQGRGTKPPLHALRVRPFHVSICFFIYKMGIITFSPSLGHGRIQ